jgi:hypothetical protein
LRRGVVEFYVRPPSAPDREPPSRTPSTSDRPSTIRTRRQYYKGRLKIPNFAGRRFPTPKDGDKKTENRSLMRSARKRWYVFTMSCRTPTAGPRRLMAFSITVRRLPAVEISLKVQRWNLHQRPEAGHCSVSRLCRLKREFCSRVRKPTDDRDIKGGAHGGALG